MAGYNPYGPNAAKVKFKITIEGADELGEKIRRAGADVIGVLPVAVRDGAQGTAALIRRRAPGPGIAIEASYPWSANVVSFDVGPDRKHWYYTFVETGVTPFEIDMISKRTSRGSDKSRKGMKAVAKLGLTGGRPIDTDHRAVKIKGRNYSRVAPGGFRARPFMRNTLIEQKEAIARYVGEVFTRTLDRLLERR